MTTVGYGDLSAKTAWGQVATTIMLYIMGISLLAQAAALYFEYRHEVRNRMLTGDWRWKMKDHIVFIHYPEEGGGRYFFKIMKHLRNSDSKKANRAVVIISTSKEVRGGLQKRIQDQNVVLINKDFWQHEAIEASCIADAAVVVIIARYQRSPESDSISYDYISRIKKINPKIRVICECVDDENRGRLQQIGADNIIRPIRMYPELVARTIIAPGTEEVIEDLFDCYNEECFRYNVKVTANWSDIVIDLLQQDVGTPIAYLNSRNQQIYTSPKPNDKVEVEAIFVIVRKGNIKTDREVQGILQNC
jgi:voltage-gated potassium channel